MVRCTAIALVAWLGLALTSDAVMAHEGHDHKILGTVTMAAADHVRLKDKDGKDVTVKVTKDTKVKSNDGTAADWVGPAGDRRPAAVTKLAPAAAAAAPQPGGNESAAIEAWLKGYDSAFNAKDLDQLATFYHPDVTIYEGGGINNGWVDYRDRHLGPELKAFENLQFGHRDITVSILPGSQAAYVRSEYFLKAKMGAHAIDSSGLATYVLIKGADGWKIRHSHTSSRPRRPGGG